VRRVEWSPQAQPDLIDACDWYEEHRSGLGGELRETLGRYTELLREFPESHPVVFTRVRRASLGRFPWSVHYLVESDRILVVALFHHSRHPLQWRGRVQERAPEFAAA